MADQKITELTALAAIPASGDQLVIVDVSDTTMSAQGTTKKIAASYFVNTSADKTFVTGDGTTGVLPAAGTVPVVSRANTFTTSQTIAPATAVTPLTVTLPGTAGAVSGLVISAFDNGSGIGGRLSVGENNNGATPAAGSINLRLLGGTSRYIWHDAAGKLRSGTTPPTNATDTSGGDIVGDQTSHIAYKDIVGEPVSDAAALAALIAAADDVKRFVYKSGSYNGQEFSGVILDGETLHRYGQDADEAHAAGKSLNIVNAIGDMMLALRALEARVAALE